MKSPATAIRRPRKAFITRAFCCLSVFIGKEKRCTTIQGSSRTRLPRMTINHARTLADSICAEQPQPGSGFPNNRPGVLHVEALACTVSFEQKVKPTSSEPRFRPGIEPAQRAFGPHGRTHRAAHKMQTGFARLSRDS